MSFSSLLWTDTDVRCHPVYLISHWYLIEALLDALMCPYFKVYFIVLVVIYKYKMMTVGDEVKELEEDIDTYLFGFKPFQE